MSHSFEAVPCKELALRSLTCFFRRANPRQMDDVAEDTELQLSTQTLASPDLFYTGHTDTFCLHIKSACLLKQARTIASRKGQELQRMARPPEQVLELDKKAVQFLRSFPKWDGIDTDWIVSGKFQPSTPKDSMVQC